MAGRVVGNYKLESQIGSGSFSVVWRAKHIHRHGDIYAIKEIATQNFCEKLRESLVSEIDILKKISHPNIIRLLDIFSDQGTCFLVLEYCNGSDLFSYFQRYGRFSEAVARDFIIQLAAGLKVLRENNLIHRDLKPQNLLLSMDGENTVLKIADFGFARPLQPQGLAETICGSPLYMAPEIMQYRKYDAKADLWSVGAILFQLVTGRPPYCGVSQMHLLHNIMKSDELHIFPSDIVGDLNPDCVDLCKKLLRRDPAKRLSFEDFFNHRFMVKPIRSMVCHENSTEGSGDSLVVENSEVSQAQCLETTVHYKEDYFKPIWMVGHENSREGLGDNLVVENSEVSQAHCTETLVDNFEKELVDSTASRNGVIDSSEDCIDEEDVFLDAEEYFIVEPETLSSSPSAEEYFFVEPETLSSSPGASGMNNSESISAPMQNIGIALGSVESQGSNIPLGSSQASFFSRDVSEKSSDHPPTRLDLLRRSAHLIAEIAKEEFQAGQQMEAFAIQLVCLAIRKQALLVSHQWTASFKESSSLEIDFHGTTVACSQIEQEFICEVESAEELASHLGTALEGTAEMPDAMQILLQKAIALGKEGALDGLCGMMDNTAALYLKSKTLFSFILFEASSLELNPPFYINASDQQQLRLYIDSLSRHNQSTEHSSDPTHHYHYTEYSSEPWLVL